MVKLYLKNFLPELALTKGRIYPGFECPKVYDPNTYILAKKSYIIICDDLKSRKVYASNFIDLQEFREQQLKKLGI